MRIVVALSLGVLVAMVANSNAYGVNSTLGQTVQPITCIYTITELGQSTSSSTACDSIAAATLDIVEPRAGRPLLSGLVTMTDLASFRVWVGGVWFTHGISPSLQISNGVWVLDLSTLSQPLQSGDYTILLEQRMTSDFLLRSIYEDALSIPIIEVIRTDTSDGGGVTSHYVSPGRHSTEELLAGIHLKDLITPVPDEQFLETARGYRLYTYDTVTANPISFFVFGYVAVAIVLASRIVYLIYSRFRISRKR